MENSKITVQALVDANTEKVWDYYTNPNHIIHWNFADPSWHCPTAENDMTIGGTYKARMEAKDGSFGFDFEAVYTDIKEGQAFSYEFGGRTATVQFNGNDHATEIIVAFDPETEHSIDMQRGGWQAILNNFKQYTENN
ncbi:SRPBCC domain-containing protein [Flavobacterium sp. H122]|uniref:SRPBCC domain-containing protein n=1 Tax=Flavobacterium sp. H122 TaxID=2529860 RepID=UPI0010A99DA0|nr:SRPBCC domain-containing protein [Flavobacterium sp. H122]